MNERLSKDPLHGITLEMQVTALVNHYGWSQLGRIIKINCFNKDPSIKSSLKLAKCHERSSQHNIISANACLSSHGSAFPPIRT